MHRIDAHQHFWQYHPVRDAWITAEMAAIKRDFLPEDLEPLLAANGFDGCVLVQSDQSEAHNGFMMQLATEHPFIKGVVGWVDLCAENIKDRLSYYQEQKIIKGFRHVLQAEQNRAFMLRPAFKRGIAALREFGFAYDILIYADQLPYIPEFVSSFPEQKFVIDHIAKPNIKEKQFEDWQKHMKAAAQHENVSCKISGMVTEADWQHWKKEDFTPYVDTVVEAFGADRIMFGSDWPVCLVAASYAEVVNIVKEYFTSFSATEQDKFFGQNAIRFYNL